MVEVESQNVEDRRFPSLDINDAEVDTEDIVCSKCGMTDTPGNDILLCDKKGCCRAYHQNCLDPRVVDPSALGEDWFCWVCETMTNCLRHINLVCRTQFSSASEVFPEAVTDASLTSPTLKKETRKRASGKSVHGDSPGEIE